MNGLTVSDGKSGLYRDEFRRLYRDRRWWGYWLECVPNPNGDDLGFADFTRRVDALLMGRNTYEKVLSFGGWPYEKPVFVLSSKLREVPAELVEKVHLVNGDLAAVVEEVRGRGFENLYVDGGKLIQSMLREDRIDTLIVTKIPFMLGKGIALFGELAEPLAWEHVQTEILLDQLVKSEYQRKR